MGPSKNVLLRELLLVDGAFACIGCGKVVDERRLTKHHVVPRASGGPTALENLVLLCRACHDRVHAHRPAEAERMRARVRAFLSGRATRWPFPPPPAPIPPEEAVRLFLYRIAARENRYYVGLRRAQNPPFDPVWPVARWLLSKAV